MQPQEDNDPDSEQSHERKPIPPGGGFQESPSVSEITLEFAIEFEPPFEFIENPDVGPHFAFFVATNGHLVDSEGLGEILLLDTTPQPEIA